MRVGTRRSALGGQWTQFPRLLGVAVATIFLSNPVSALPTGRAWTPMDTTTVPGHTRLFPDRLDVDSLGRLTLTAASAGGIGRDTHILRWADSTWTLVASWGYGTAYSHPVISTGPGFPLTWQTTDDVLTPGVIYGRAYLVAATFDGVQVVNADTVGLVWNGGYTYSGAATSRRRWEIKKDYGALRAWYSDSLRTWREVQIPEDASYGSAIAPLDDSTAMIALQSEPSGSPLQPARWGLVRGTKWVDMGQLPQRASGIFAFDFHFHRVPGGGYWLGWATDDAFVQMTRMQAGAWLPAESLTCKRRFSGQSLSQVLAVSRDPWHDRPAVAWIEYNANRGFSGELCVCVPNAQGYPEGESLPIEADPEILDTIQDQNDDVWVVWQEQFWGMYWTHSYVTALASKPRPIGDARPIVNWSLSAPAPGSYWAVLRARSGGPYEQVARVRAGPGTEMSWEDTSVPFLGLLHYRIRRESVDRRYEQTSSDAIWLPRKARLWVEAPIEQSGSGVVRLQIYGATPGALDSRAFDLQGREVARLHSYASGTGEDQVEFALSGPSGRLPSGIYFVRVTDATGRTSDAIKAVVVR